MEEEEKCHHMYLLHFLQLFIKGTFSFYIHPHNYMAALVMDILVMDPSWIACIPSDRHGHIFFYTFIGTSQKGVYNVFIHIPHGP